MELASYQVQVKGTPEFQETFHTYSRGKAKSLYLRRVNEVYPTIKFTDLLCKKVGAPSTSESFKKCADYRGIPFAYCGMKVELPNGQGFIVGHNSFANIDVLFTTGPNRGHVFNCHPNYEIKYFDKKGEIIKEF